MIDSVPSPTTGSPTTGPDDGPAGESELAVRQQRVPAAEAGARLDQVAARLFPEYSRALLVRWLAAGALTVDGRSPKPKARLHGGELLELDISRAPYENWSEPQRVDFACLYEDEDLLVVNKPAGLVVHPGAGNFDGTLVNGLLAHRSGLAELPRAGIVHRLDKDTSGLLLVAGSLVGLTALSRAISKRLVERRYLAIAHGLLLEPLTIDAAIGRDPRVPTRQQVHEQGRSAVTHVRPLAHFTAHSLVEARLETGRTHQIRVHMQHAGYPLVGDSRYGGRLRAQAKRPEAVDNTAWDALLGFQRQALHATELALEHPVSGAPLRFQAEPPEDFAALLAALGGIETEDD